MNEQFITALSKNFDYLIPKDLETLLVLFALQYRIENGQMNDSFNQKDFDDTIDEVAEYLRREKSIQKETLSKRLSQRFLTTLKSGNEYHFQLTMFTRELIKLLKEELQPHYENLELIHTFKRTMPLLDTDLESFDKFNYWFDNHYIPSRKVILSHTDSLQRYVDERITELKQLLKPDIKNTRNLITRFIIVFEQLGKQAEGIIQTLNYREDIIDKIKNSEAKFSETKEMWEKYIRIQQEITGFFENVDKRVLSVNDKIQLTCSRLKTLYDTLRYKQEFIMKIEDLLFVLLRYSVVQEGVLLIPSCIKNKFIPGVKEKFIFLPSMLFGSIFPREIPAPHEDEEYRLKKEAENMKALKRQEAVAKWLAEIYEQVLAGKEVCFEEWFDRMMGKENNLEVPIDVCFGLIQEYNKDKGKNLSIETIPVYSPNDFITLWKMKIIPNPL